MKSIVSVLLCVLAFGGSSKASIASSRGGRTAPVQEKSVDVTGTWAFQIDLGGTTGTPTVTFKQDGDKLSGTYSSQVIGEHEFTGTIKGNALTFGFEASFDGNPVKVTYSGTVEKDSMKGEVTFGDLGGGTFTAKKKAQEGPAAPFLGDWTLAMEGPNGPATFGLTIKVEKETVVADITSETQPAQSITDVSKSEKSLVLRYSFDYQGMAVPTVVTLTPGAEKEKIAAHIDFASGAYEMSGTGTKKEPK